MRPQKLEIELTNACNAICESCKRTQLIAGGQPFKIRHLTLDDITDMFLNIDLTGAKIKFCGVLGDPIANKELLEITEYFILEKNIKHIEVSTNGGLKTSGFWNSYGELSKLSGGKLEVHFAIDGVTRNDYRVNVDLNKAWKNVDAYLESGGKAIWQYIIFDYNKHELTSARKLAKEKGIGFASRTAWRNDASGEEKAKITQQSVERTYCESNISCQHLNNQEIFIGADKTVWPCCYLYDEHVSGGLPQFDSNNLNDMRLEEILQNEWFSGLLEESLNKEHELNIPRCWRSCGDNGSRRTKKVIE